jgi:hypothetical protein
MECPKMGCWDCPKKFVGAKEHDKSYDVTIYELHWCESLSLSIEEILVHACLHACVRLSPWDHNGSVKS